MINMPYPDEDSEDLHDEEILGSTVTDSENQLAQGLIHCSCDVCEKPFYKEVHAIRRRGSDLYARVILQCKAGHTLVKTFRVNWMVNK